MLVISMKNVRFWWAIKVPREKNAVFSRAEFMHASQESIAAGVIVAAWITLLISRFDFLIIVEEWF